jgi:hypothetical protein
MAETCKSNALLSLIKPVTPDVFLLLIYVLRDVSVQDFFYKGKVLLQEVEP